MVWLLAILACIGFVLLASVLSFILTWLLWFWQLWLLFVMIPYYAIRGLIAAVRWLARIGRKAPQPDGYIFPPRR